MVGGRARWEEGGREGGGGKPGRPPAALVERPAAARARTPAQRASNVGQKRVPGGQVGGGGGGAGRRPRARGQRGAWARLAPSRPPARHPTLPTNNPRDVRAVDRGRCGVTGGRGGRRGARADLRPPARPAPPARPRPRRPPRHGGRVVRRRRGGRVGRGRGRRRRGRKPNVRARADAARRSRPPTPPPTRTPPPQRAEGHLSNARGAPSERPGGGWQGGGRRVVGGGRRARAFIGRPPSPRPTRPADEALGVEAVAARGPGPGCRRGWLTAGRGTGGGALGGGTRARGAAGVRPPRAPARRDAAGRRARSEGRPPARGWLRRCRPGVSGQPLWRLEEGRGTVVAAARARPTAPPPPPPPQN